MRAQRQKMIDLMDSETRKQSPQFFAMMLQEIGQVQQEIKSL